MSPTQLVSVPAAGLSVAICGVWPLQRLAVEWPSADQSEWSIPLQHVINGNSVTLHECTTLWCVTLPVHLFKSMWEERVRVCVCDMYVCVAGYVGVYVVVPTQCLILGKWQQWQNEKRHQKCILQNTSNQPLIECLNMRARMKGFAWAKYP